MLCNYITSSKIENQHAKDCDTADYTACNQIKIKKIKIEAHKLIHNNSQILTANKETFTQPQSAEFTRDNIVAEHLKALFKNRKNSKILVIKLEI